MMLGIKSVWYQMGNGMDGQMGSAGLEIDFSKGRSDIIAMQKFLSAQIIGKADGTSAVERDILPEQPEGLVGQFLN